MYGIKRLWNVTEYTNNGHLNPKLPHAKRLQIVGDEKGQFYLQVKNISLYDAGLYRCHIIMNDYVIIETFIIQINQLIELDITYDPFVPLKEGHSLNLCCHSNSTVLNQTLRWFNEQRGLQEPTLSSEACLYFKNFSRNDSGNYTCIAEYEGEIGTKDILLSVSYSPGVTFVYENYTESDRYRHIQCNANGYPRNYTYKQWVHTSFFDEHIRYLTGNATGYLRLPTHKRQFRYQDSGVYVCSVSNGVSDNSGQCFQKDRAYVISKGSPIFVEDNKYKQYGNKEHHFDVKVKVFSFSNITCQHISSKSGMRMQLFVMINRVKMWADFYGKNIKVIGWAVVFRIPDLSEIDFKEFVITICNEFGNASFTLELLPEENNIQSIPSNSIIVDENMDIALVTEGQHLAITNNDDNTSKSASSDNDSNTSENLNDGYEHPYTKLMINNRTEDEHVYLPSTTNVSNEHSTLFENAACKLSFALTELSSTHAITKTHFCQNEVHENENSNDVEDSISRSNVFSQTNIPEYINLSLKQ
ncbi:NCAM [Mytilus coruscus]|uniref:NCAM n=1 Tax=Mytilus coruscus TaxID=42192 RepID=A0A6J8EB24_MYTCO|nr:NCAM [Mytilus coruscus]